MKNIVLLSFDCLRYDANIELPIKNHIIKFHNAYANATTTSYSMPSLMTGIPPFTSIGKEGITKSHPVTIAELLKMNGYKTYGFSSTNPNCSGWKGFKRGFDVFDDYLCHKETIDKQNNYKKFLFKRLRSSKLFQKIYGIIFDLSGGLIERLKYISDQSSDLVHKLNTELTIPGRRLFEDARKIINITDTPFFLWMHFMDNHIPYCSDNDWLKEKFKSFQYPKYNQVTDKLSSRKKWKWISNQEHNYIKLLYNYSVKYINELLKDIFEWLSSNNLTNETVLFIVSDHGELFNKEGKYTHPHECLYDDQIRVPLLIYHPDMESMDLHNVVSNLDVFNTISSLTGHTFPCFGNNLFTNTDDSNDLCCSYERGKESFNKVALFSQKGLIKFNSITPSISERLQNYEKRYHQIKEFWAEKSEKSLNNDESEIYEKKIIKQRLKDLGYLD